MLRTPFQGPLASKFRSALQDGLWDVLSEEEVLARTQAVVLETYSGRALARA